VLTTSSWFVIVKHNEDKTNQKLRRNKMSDALKRLLESNKKDSSNKPNEHSVWPKKKEETLVEDKGMDEIKDLLKKIKSGL
jgi:hypothetical protein